MALDISATDTELQKPVNVLFQQTLLRNARANCPYFAGTQPAEITGGQSGTATVKWRRIENLTPTTTALAELTTTASFGMGRDSSLASFTDVTATAQKYGQFYIINEEVELYNFNGTTDKLVETLGISAGQSLDRLQRDVVDDNSTIIRGGNVASDGLVITTVAKNDLKRAINELNRNDGIRFTDTSLGDDTVGTQPILPSYWAACHPDVAEDLVDLTGFKSVETYAKFTDLAPGEFGYFATAGTGIRFVQTTDAVIDADAGEDITSQDVRGTSDADLYNIAIWGQDSIGSVGVNAMHVQEVYQAGDPLPAVQLIVHGAGSAGTGDPFNEVSTLAWKAFHAGAVLNTAWTRVVRVASTRLDN